MIERDITQVTPEADAYRVIYFRDEEESTFVQKERTLPSGNILRRKEWYTDDNSYSRAYDVLSPSGNEAKITFRLLETDTQPFSFSANWTKETSLKPFLAGANEYFEAAAQARGSGVETVDVTTLTEWSSYDVTQEGQIVFPVRLEDVKHVAEQRGDTFYDVDDVTLSTVDGQLVDSGWYMHVFPTPSRDTDSTSFTNALLTLYEATSDTPEKAADFKEALAVIVKEEALW